MANYCQKSLGRGRFCGLKAVANSDYCEEHAATSKRYQSQQWMMYELSSARYKQRLDKLKQQDCLSLEDEIYLAKLLMQDDIAKATDDNNLNEEEKRQAANRYFERLKTLSGTAKSEQQLRHHSGQAVTKDTLMGALGSFLAIIQSALKRHVPDLEPLIIDEMRPGLLSLAKKLHDKEKPNEPALETPLEQNNDS